MHSLSSIAGLRRLEGPVHLAIGVFDGVHRGHQAVLASAQEQAATEEGITVAATFNPHPAEVLAPAKAPKRLTPLAHQKRLMQRLGIPATLAIPFTLAMADQAPETFVQELCEACPLASIHVGTDWTFGKDRQGTLSSLRLLGRRHGFSVHGIAPVTHQGTRISSSAIRLAIAAGDLAQARDLLGRPYSLYGPVVQGQQLGRKLGFPTANIAFDAAALPPHGVYIVRLTDPSLAAGVANLGYRPSVSGASELRLEVHLLDAAEDLYDRWLEVEFLHHLRQEQAFPSLKSLQTQIANDVSQARHWLASAPLPATSLSSSISEALVPPPSTSAYTPSPLRNPKRVPAKKQSRAS